MNETQLIRVEEAATRADTSTKTIRRWYTSGVLTAYQALPGGRVRIDAAELDALIHTRRAPTTKAAPKRRPKAPRKRETSQRRRASRPGRTEPRGAPSRITLADLAA